MDKGEVPAANHESANHSAQTLQRQWKNMWILVVALLLLKFTMRVLADETGYIELAYAPALFALAIPVTMAYYAYKITGKRMEILINGILGVVQIFFVGPILSYFRLKKILSAQVKEFDPQAQLTERPRGVVKLLIGVIILLVVLALLGVLISATTQQ